MDANFDVGTTICDRKVARALLLAAQELDCVVTGDEPVVVFNGCSTIDLTMCRRSVTFGCDSHDLSNIECWRVGKFRPQGSP